MGVGDSWGTREELLHPRDSKGRFRSKWKMSKAAMDRVLGVLGSFVPKTWPSDQEAATYVSGLGDKSKGKLPLERWSQMQADIRAGKPSKDLAAYEAAEQPLPEDLILTSVMDAKAFGLTPETIGQMEEYTGKLVANKGPTSTNVGTPVGPGQVTLTIATPKGTMAVIPGGGSREVILSPEQPLRITKVDPDGKGGFYVYATAMPKGAKGETRTKKLGTRAPTPTDPDGDGVPGVAPAAPGQAPADPNAPQERVEEVQSPSVGGDGAPSPDEVAPGAPPSPDTSPPLQDGKSEPGTPEQATPETGPGPVNEDVSRAVQDRAAEILADRIASGGQQEPTPGTRSDADIDREIAQAERRKKTETREAIRPGAGEARRKANEESRKRNQESQEKLSREVDAEIQAVADAAGVELPEDPFLRTMIGLTDVQMKSGSLSRKKAAKRYREMADTRTGTDADKLRQFADSVESTPVKKVAKKATPAKAAPEPTPAPSIPESVRAELNTASLGELRQIAREENIQIPPNVRGRTAIRDLIRAQRAQGGKGAPDGKPVPAVGDVDNATIPTLRQIAKDEGIPIPSSVRRKADIVARIKQERANRTGPAKAAPAKATALEAGRGAKKAAPAPKKAASVSQVRMKTLDALERIISDVERDDEDPEPFRAIRKRYAEGDLNAQEALDEVSAQIFGNAADGQGIRDLIRVTSDVPPAKKAIPAPAKSEKVTPDLDDDAVRERVTSSLERLARQPGEPVLISRLRNELKDVPREQVDRILREMARGEGFHLVPEANQKTLTQADRDAAISLGDQDKHLIVFEGRRPTPPAKKATPAKAVPEGTVRERGGLVVGRSSTPHGLAPGDVVRVAGQNRTVKDSRSGIVTFEDGGRIYPDEKIRPVSLVAPAATPDGKREALRAEGKLAPGDVVVQPTPQDVPRVVEVDAATQEIVEDSSLADLRSAAKALGVTVPVGLRTRQQIMQFLANEQAKGTPRKAVKGAKKAAPKKAGPKITEVPLDGFFEGVDRTRTPAIWDLVREQWDEGRSPRDVAKFLESSAQGYLTGQAIEWLDRPGRDEAMRRAQEDAAQMRMVAERLRRFRRPVVRKGSTKGVDIDESMFAQHSADEAIRHRGQPWAADVWTRPGLTERENAAAMAYTDGDLAVALNDALRRNDLAAADKLIRERTRGSFDLESMREALDSAIADSALENDTELWRGTFMTEDEITRLLPGVRLKNGGYTSTASVKDGMEHVMDLWPNMRPDLVRGKRRVHHRILAPKGTKAVGVSGGAHEMLLGRGTETEIVRIDPGTGPDDPPTITWRIVNG